jgi:hypothetical protein
MQDVRWRQTTLDLLIARSSEVLLIYDTPVVSDAAVNALRCSIILLHACCDSFTTSAHHTLQQVTCWYAHVLKVISSVMSAVWPK